MTLSKITPCLWFDHQAEEAANFYISVFPAGRILSISHFGEAGFAQHHRPAGSVMVVAFELDGHGFTALNGGPLFRFNEAVSLQVNCETQAEIDYFWERLRVDGDPKAQQCGWLKDRYGVSWQVVPAKVIELFDGPSTPATERAMRAMMTMKKLDLAALEAAYAGDRGQHSAARSG
jgi:predicted 3-demethylubiquinone-9 3-methyltransferase (glyoxalase superfamily)